MSAERPNLGEAVEAFCAETGHTYAEVMPLGPVRSEFVCWLEKRIPLREATAEDFLEAERLIRSWAKQ